MYTHVKAHARNTVRASYSFLAYIIFPTSSLKAARGARGPRYACQHEAGNGLRGQSCQARKAQDEFNFARNIDAFRAITYPTLSCGAIKGANIAAPVLFSALRS